MCFILIRTFKHIVYLLFFFKHWPQIDITFWYMLKKSVPPSDYSNIWAQPTSLKCIPPPPPVMISEHT